MIVEGIAARAYPAGEEPDQGGWPFTLAPVAQLLREGLRFDRPVTFLVGENGSGKSTIVEAIAETSYGFFEYVTGTPAYGGHDLLSLSHGESFLAVFDTRFNRQGLYLLDEPESALSFTSCLKLLALLGDIAERGSQVICATHSPLLAALPGAQILEIGEHGIREVAWQDLELVDHWRRFLSRPDAYLRHLTDD